MRAAHGLQVVLRVPVCTRRGHVGRGVRRRRQEAAAIAGHNDPSCWPLDAAAGRSSAAGPAGGGELATRCWQEAGTATCTKERAQPGSWRGRKNQVKREIEGSPESKMMTVSAVARLMPRPPARVESRNAKSGEPARARRAQGGSQHWVPPPAQNRAKFDRRQRRRSMQHQQRWRVPFWLQAGTSDLFGRRDLSRGRSLCCADLAR